MLPAPHSFGTHPCTLLACEHTSRSHAHGARWTICPPLPTASMVADALTGRGPQPQGCATAGAVLSQFSWHAAASPEVTLAESRPLHARWSSIVWGDPGGEACVTILYTLNGGPWTIRPHGTMCVSPRKKMQCPPADRPLQLTPLLPARATAALPSLRPPSLHLRHCCPQICAWTAGMAQQRSCCARPRAPLGPGRPPSRSSARAQASSARAQVWQRQAGVPTRSGPWLQQLRCCGLLCCGLR